MAPRRRLRRSERSPLPQEEPEIERDEEYPNVQFRDQAQKDKFTSMKERFILYMHFICANVLRTLGIFLVYNAFV